MSRKNRILVSILILMGAAMLSSCTSAAGVDAANNIAVADSICADFEMV